MVRNARAKIRRTQKTHGVDLSGAVDLPSLDDFGTRDEFNQWKQDVGSFTNRYNLRYQFVTNPYGVTASKSEINEIERMRKREQRVAREEYNRVKDKIIHQGGKPFATVEQRTTHFSMPDVTGVTIPKDFDFSKVRSQRRLDEIKEIGERRQYPEHYDWRKEQMKMNFMKGLEESYDSEADELIDRLANLPPDDFYFLYIGNTEFDFDELFYEDGEAVGITNREGHINKMMNVLDRFEREIRNPDLDGF